MPAVTPSLCGVGRCHGHLGGGRESQGPPPSAPLDMTTPLGLSRQHLSYLQEIGSGWFGKVSGLGGREAGGPDRPGLYSCFVSIPPAPTTSHLLPPACSLCPRSPPITLTPVHLSPTPTHPIPPHLSVSASLLTPLITPPRHLALHASVCPSFHPSVPASIGLWACESLTRAGGGRGWDVRGGPGKRGKVGACGRGEGAPGEGSRGNHTL